MAAGRPKKKIDYDLVGKLAAIQCTEIEIAGILDISERTLQRDAEFCRIYALKKDSGKASLRRMQWKKAEEGNATLLIWLGKQYLGQRDKQEMEHSGGTSLDITTKPDYSKLSTEELKALVELGKKAGA